LDFWFTASFDRTASVVPESPTSPNEKSAGKLGASVAPGRDQRILVAEDNSTNCEVILAQLKKIG